MKKLLAVVAVIGLVGFATSCKKECKCTLLGVDYPTTGVIDTKEACDDFAKLFAGDEEASSVLKCEWK
jgi:hypothetical protein